MAKFEKLCANTGVVKINAEKGEVITVAEGAFLSMTDTFDVVLQSHKGMKKTLEKLISGHKVMTEEYTARENGELVVTDSRLGDVLIVKLEEDKEYVIEQKCFLASAGEITYPIKDEGVKGMFRGEGIFRLDAKGTGTLCLSAYGSIIEKELKEGESIIIDTEHIILRHLSTGYNIMELEHTKRGRLEGEGRVVKISGPGSVWYQTKTLNSYMSNPEL